MSVVNEAGKLHPVTFKFSYATFCLYNIGFLQLQIHISWKTKQFDRLLRGPTHYKPYLTLGTSFSKSKWLTPWPRHMDRGRGKKHWIQHSLKNKVNDLVSALYIRWCFFWLQASSCYFITEWSCSANPLGRQDWDLRILACLAMVSDCKATLDGASTPG